MSAKNDLAAPLLSGERHVDWMSTMKASCYSLSGMLMVTSAALLFGVVAAFVKATNLPTLLMLQCRSVLEWAIGVGVGCLYAAKGKNQVLKPLPQAEAEVASRRSVQLDPASPETEPTSFMQLLIGPPELLGWLVLRAFLYWGFLGAWWLALESMPIGDATTIVYCGPIFTAVFARIFLGERIDWTFYPIVVLDACGLVLITRPAFLFHDGPTAATAASSSYMLGAASALFSAIVAGLLPVCTRISKRCFWTAVNHVSSALSALVFTPLAFVVWFAVDPTAAAVMDNAWGEIHSSEPHASLLPGIGRLGCLVGATVTGFGGLALQTLCYQREEVRRVLSRPGCLRLRLTLMLPRP